MLFGKKAIFSWKKISGRFLLMTVCDFTHFLHVTFVLEIGKWKKKQEENQATFENLKSFNNRMMEKYGVVLTVFPFKSFTRQCKWTLVPRCVVTLTGLTGSSKNGNGSWVVVSSPSSISLSSGVSVNGDENSCQKFFGYESNGSPSRGFITANDKQDENMLNESKLGLIVRRQ